MKFDVFISYSQRDKSTADAVCAKLESNGVRCWIAPRDVEPGSEWAASIVDAIDHCRAMVLVFSSQANNSKQIHREVQQAFDREVAVVPIRIENVVPTKSLAYYMGPVHWLDALTPPLEQHLQKLSASVAALLRASGTDFDLRIGGKLDHFEIRERLSDSGLGQIYGAYDTLLGRPVAIKGLRSELLTDRKFVEGLRAEIANLARLNHPNIVTIYSLITEGSNLFVIMELVRGDSLDALLRSRGGSLGIKETLGIIGQAAEGLAYAHSVGIIHRNLKPSDLMISETGLVKITEFGTSLVQASQPPGQIIATLAYLAPEVLRGEAGREQTDVYCLAVVLYQMLSGSPPFKMDSDFELMQAILNDPPQPLGPLVPGLDPKIDTALSKALSKELDQRFASVKAFKEAIGASGPGLDLSLATKGAAAR